MSRRDPACEKGDDTCPYRDTPHCLGKKEKAGEDLDDVELGRLLGLYYAYRSVDNEPDRRAEGSPEAARRSEARSTKPRCRQDMAEQGRHAHVFRGGTRLATSTSTSGS